MPNDLEFQLTLNVKLEKPAYLQAPKAKPSKTSTLSKVFASPKKRKEIELRQREEERFAQQQKEAMIRQMNGTPSGYELISPIVAEDGSFARSYVCLKEHESRCFGRPYMAEVMCFNEWASEEEGFASSVKSKRGTGALVRRAPYKIGKLELQLLFVPRPKNITDDEMPHELVRSRAQGRRREIGQELGGPSKPTRRRLPGKLHLVFVACDFVANNVFCIVLAQKVL